MFSFKEHKTFIFILAIAIILRAVSFHFNVIVHEPEYPILIENLNEGHTWYENIVWTEGWPGNPPSPYIYPWFQISYYYAALPLFRIIGNAYESMKLMSLIAGIFVLIFSYLAARKLFDKDTAALSSLLIAFSTVLIDFSSNGSVYMLVTLLMLLYVYFLISIERLKVFSALLFGFFLTGSLVIYNTMGVVLASFFVLALFDKKVRKLLSNLLFWAGFLFGSFAYVLHNQWAFGTSSSSQTTQIIDLIFNGSVLTLIKKYIMNITLFSYKSVFVFSALLIPFIFLGLIFILRNYFSLPEKTKTTLKGIFILLFFYMAMMLLMNIKIRRFVPLVPLFAVIAAFYLINLAKDKRLLVYTIVFFYCLISLIPLVRFPHTYYYALDEESWVIDYLDLEECGKFLATQPEGTILDPDHAFLVFYYARYPYIAAGDFNDKQIEELISKYAPSYILVNTEDIYKYSGYSLIKSCNRYHILSKVR